MLESLNKLILIVVAISFSSTIQPIFASSKTSEEPLYIQNYKKVLPQLPTVNNMQFADLILELPNPGSSQLREDILALSKIWPSDVKVPDNLVTACCAAFASLSSNSPERLVEFEPLFVKLLTEKK